MFLTKPNEGNIKERTYCQGKVRPLNHLPLPSVQHMCIFVVKFLACNDRTELFTKSLKNTKLPFSCGS